MYCLASTGSKEGKMGYIDKAQHWVIETIGLVFLVVGASKWLYDLIFLNDVHLWRIYLVMIIAGTILSGYMKMGRALIGIKMGHWKR